MNANKTKRECDILPAHLARDDIKRFVGKLFGFLDPRAGRTAQPQRELAGVDLGKYLVAEIAADQQDDTGGYQQIGPDDRPPQGHGTAGEQAIAVAKTIETGPSGHLGRMTTRQNPDQQHRHERRGQHIGGDHGEPDRERHRNEQVVRSALHEEGGNKYG